MILVTGGSGLLGANLALMAQASGYETVALYHQHPVRLAGVKCLQADLTDPKITRQLVTELRPDWIINCAAHTNIDWCETHPAEARRANTEMPGELARAAAKIGAGLVYISTDAIFDGESKQDYTEEDTPRPINIYAETKLAGEKAVQAEGDHYLIIRANMYGWNAQPKFSQSERVLLDLEAGKAVKGWQDVVISSLLVNDLSELILEMTRRNLSGIYNLGSAQPFSKYEFSRQIAHIFELNPALVEPSSVEEAGLPAPRSKYLGLATTKICRELGTSMPDLLAGLNKFKLLRENGYANRIRKMTHTA
jgi:dTDP-4-dehydrorhamnose reductase